MKKLITASLFVSTGLTLSGSFEILDMQHLSNPSKEYASIFPTKPPRPKNKSEANFDLTVKGTNLSPAGTYTSIFPTKPPRTEQNSETKGELIPLGSSGRALEVYASIFPTKPPRKKVNLA